MESSSERAQELEVIMREGVLVPDELMVALLQAAMLKSGAHTFLVDGFPRSVPQAEVRPNISFYTTFLGTFAELLDSHGCDILAQFLDSRGSPWAPSGHCRCGGAATLSGGDVQSA